MKTLLIILIFALISILGYSQTNPNCAINLNRAYRDSGCIDMQTTKGISSICMDSKGNITIRSANDTIYMQGHVIATQEMSYPVTHEFANFHDSAVALGNTRNVAAWVTNSGHNLWTANATSSMILRHDSVICNNQGNYTLKFRINYQDGSNNNWQIVIYKNGTPSAFSEMQTSNGTGNYLIEAIADNMDLKVGDVIRIYLTNTTANDHCTLISGWMELRKEHD